MFCIVPSSPFSYFQIKVFKISRVIEGANSQLINLKFFLKKFFRILGKKKKEKEKENTLIL